MANTWMTKYYKCMRANICFGILSTAYKCCARPGEEGGNLFGGAFKYLDGGGGTGKPSPFMVPVDCPDDLFENMSPGPV